MDIETAAHRRVHYLKSLRKLAQAPLLNKPERADDAFALYADLLEQEGFNHVAVDEAVRAHLVRSKYFPTPSELVERVREVATLMEDRRARAHTPPPDDVLDAEAQRFADLGERWFPERYGSAEVFAAFDGLITELSVEYTNRNSANAARLNREDRADYIFTHPRYAALCQQLGYDPNGRVEEGKVLIFPTAAPELSGDADNL